MPVKIAFYNALLSSSKWKVESAEWKAESGKREVPSGKCGMRSISGKCKVSNLYKLHRSGIFVEVE